MKAAQLTEPCPARGDGVSGTTGVLVSCVEHALGTTTSHYDPKQIIESIRTDKLFCLREPIQTIRNTFASVMASTSGDRKAAKKAVADAKKRLPGVMWSGSFRERSAEKLLEHSGLLCADLDELGDRLPDVREKLPSSPHLWALFTSPTGDGLKCVFRVPADAQKHGNSFRAVEQHVRELCGVQIDESCKDVARLCFLSHDPDAYLNERAVQLAPLTDAKVDKPAIAAASLNNPQIERCRRIAAQLLGDIRWVSETRGFGTCPYLESHTTPDGDRDLRVDVDGVPTIFCFHASCHEKIAELNVTFRSRIHEADAENILGETYFVDDKYWRKSGEAWRPITKQNFADDLRVTGFSARPSSKTDRASDVLRLMSRIRGERVLDAAVPIVHDSREIVELNCRQVLNISRIKAMQPAEADDPEKSAWLHEFFDKVWDPDQPRQRNYFLAWFKRFYQHALEGHPVSGQAAVIAGEAGIGKTFLSWRIIGSALGGFSDGARFLKGETSFNKEIAEVPLLAIDDSEIADDVAARNKFSSTVKKFVADPQITYHPKGVDEITIPCKNRIIITCNQDAHSLGVLPRLDTSISEKLMFFKFGAWRPNYKLPGGPEAHLKEILPLWLRWLLDWTPPAYVLSDDPRFGVFPYKHPVLVGAVEEESPQTTLKHLIDTWFQAERKTEPEWLSARQLRDKLSWLNRDVLTKELGGPRLGRTLSSLGKDYVLESRTNRSTNAGEYLVTSPMICKN